MSIIKKERNFIFIQYISHKFTIVVWIKITLKGTSTYFCRENVLKCFINKINKFQTKREFNMRVHNNMRFNMRVQKFTIILFKQYKTTKNNKILLKFGKCLCDRNSFIKSTGIWLH